MKIIYLYATIVWFSPIAAFLPKAINDHYKIDAFVSVAAGIIGILFALAYNSIGIKKFSNWLPWGIVLLIGIYRTDNFQAYYRAFLMLSPLLVALGVYGTKVSFRKIYRYLTLLSFISLFCIFFGTLYTAFIGLDKLHGFQLPGSVTTAAALSSLIVSLNTNYIRRYLGMAIAFSVPLLGVNRMALMAVTIQPLLRRQVVSTGISRWLLIICGVLLILTTIISLPFVQEKMFYSGSGSLTTFINNPLDVRTNGRLAMWTALLYDMNGEDWIIGHGADASAVVSESIIRGITHPHNDWLRILYDYGIIGIISFVYLIIREWYRAEHFSEINLKISVRIGLITMVLLMLTGNVIVYSVYFGNILFFLVGLGDRRFRK